MWTEKNNGIEFAVKIVPGARSNEIVGWENNVLKIRISVVPERGKANDALRKLLAKACGVRMSQVEILSGQTSRNKRIFISDIKTLSFD